MIAKRAIEGLCLWAFYTILVTLFTPSKQEAIALAVALAILFLFCFMVIVAFTLIYNSLHRLSAKYKFKDNKFPHSNGDIH